LLAERLLEAHPETEPLELDGDALGAMIASAGGDADDIGAVAATLAAWERLRI
jgi:hypothetical protein